MVPSMVHAGHANVALRTCCLVALLLSLAGIFYLFSAEPTSLPRAGLSRTVLSTATSTAASRTNGRDHYPTSEAIFHALRGKPKLEVNAGELDSSTALSEEQETDVDAPALHARNPLAPQPSISNVRDAAVTPRPLIRPQAAEPSTDPDKQLLPATSEARLENPSCTSSSSADNTLQPFPKNYGPDDPSWRNSIAICTSIRDENVTDVREWLQYYRWLGVDRVLLTENNSRKPIGKHLKDFVDAGFLTYRQEPAPYAQIKIYRWCLQRHRTRFNWMAFIDADEFLVIRERGVTLKGLLDEFKHEAGIGVHWIMMGSNGRQRRPEEGGVLRHYTSCNPAPQPSSKVIANMYYTAAMIGHPHTALFWDCRTSVNEAKVPFPLVATGQGYPEHTSDHPSADRLALFHYVTKSKDDFGVKSLRRGGDGLSKPLDFFHKMQKGQRRDRLCEELRIVADQCCSPGTGPALATQME